MTRNCSAQPELSHESSELLQSSTALTKSAVSTKSTGRLSDGRAARVACNWAARA